MLPIRRHIPDYILPANFYATPLPTAADKAINKSVPATPQSSVADECGLKPALDMESSAVAENLT
jgi:hypothetical protein